MKKTNKRIAAIAAALATAVTLSGCAAADNPDYKEADYEIEERDPETETELPPEIEQPEEEPETPQDPIEVTVPKAQTVSYVNVLSSGVNIRSGAGTNYSVRGTAEKSTLYAMNGSTGSWYQTGYKNNDAYISSNYCEIVEMPASEDERIEAVIAEGTKLLGTPYVYGAARYHNGNGVLASNFNVGAFDCSSLMQYIFSKGAGINLQVTSRTQSLQGTTVSASKLQRGDLMFFTNASRYNYSGIERIGHVALYLGDNWILHTASDYAKIEQISATRWSYFIQAQRMF